MANIKDLETLLNSEDINGSIIELDDFICGLSPDVELSAPQKVFYYNQNLEREINNGGFSQFFGNSSGDNAHETVLSLQEIGATKTAGMLQQAIDQFPEKTVPKDREERVALIEQIEDVANDVWDELDQRFYKYEDDLNTLNIEYVKKNKASF